MPSPFPPSTSTPGIGTVKLSLRPPDQPVFEVLSFSYPLKLVVSAPHHLHNAASRTEVSTTTRLHPSSVPLLFLLTYGGGLVSGDQIHLFISLAPTTRLTIATQGSTRIFRPSLPHDDSYPAQSPSLTGQNLRVQIGANAALWLGPDPCQPFALSRYAQTQIFEVDVTGEGSLGLVDWVSEGRSARGEKWRFDGWRGRNEIWDVSTCAIDNEEEHPGKRKRLIIRDNLILSAPDIASRVDGLGIFGTIIMIGPLFSSLAIFFIDEFKALPRIGARDWNTHQGSNLTDSSTGKLLTDEERQEKWRKHRQEKEQNDGVRWTAAHVRGAVVVKFGAREVEGARVWLREMLTQERSLEKQFGSGALTCVK
ncbi:MAG: hypothetical protein LQ339_000054 [Xanthoria mediterranea]|nr:MAG: hypothetical protein LQ339_000054 [Xanthoria mediterranea]